MSSVPSAVVFSLSVMITSTIMVMVMVMVMVIVIVIHPVAHGVAAVPFQTGVRGSADADRDLGTRGRKWDQQYADEQNAVFHIVPVVS